MPRDMQQRCNVGKPLYPQYPENYSLEPPLFVGLDSSVGIATRYGPDSPRIEFRCGMRYSIFSRPALMSTQPPVQKVPDLFPGDKAAGAWH